MYEYRLWARVLGVIILFSMFIAFAPSAYADQKANSEILFFYNPGCHHCLKVKNEILPRLLERTSKEVKIKFLDISEISNYQLLLELEEKFPVIGEGDRPRIFIGDVILVGEKAIKEKLVEKINSLSGKTKSPPLLKPPEKLTLLLLERFKSFSFLAITTAGFLDGHNPCAFAVIIFFIALLYRMKYKRKEMVVIGSTFTIAVFITYFLLGLGILRGLQRLTIFYPIAKGVNLVIGVFALILAFLNFRDFYIYKKTGSFKETKLKLSGRTHNFMHRIISKYFRREEGVGRKQPLIILSCFTFLVGVLVAICTAACTGQVYLPTIVFMLSSPMLRSRATFYLIVYNLMYILPLAVIFLISLLGISSERLARWGRMKFGLMKILLGILFLVLGVILINVWI